MIKVSERFICSGCGGNRLEEVLSEVTQYTEILGFYSDYGNLDYGHNNTEGGVLNRYQCLTCGRPVRPTTEEEFQTWLAGLPVIRSDNNEPDQS